MRLRESEPPLTLKNRFGELLREMRAAHVPPLTQKTLAQRMEVSRALVNLMEQGRRAPTREFVSRVVEALELHASATTLLWEAAGFVPPTPSAQIAATPNITRLLPSSEQNPILAHLAGADVLPIIEGWRALTEADRALRDGRYEQASAMCLEMFSRHYATPTLRLYARRTFAEAQRLKGKLDDAADTIAANVIAADLPDDDVSPQGEFVRALLLAQLGEVELRRGHYEQARMHFEDSQHGYAALLVSSSDETRLVLHLGLGMAFERMAKAALFLGATTQAEDYCKVAALHLESAAPSPQRDEVRRKVEELRAWALARKGDFVNAIPLHEKSRKAAESSGDRAGVVKNCVYLGDDWRRRVEKAIEDVCLDKNGVYHARRPRDAYEAAREREPEIDGWVDQARRSYQRAMWLMEEHAAPYMMGLCMRNLGIIARFQGNFAEADVWLHRAELQDRSMGLNGRLHAIFEARGDLYWQQDMSELAVKWYSQALEALDELVSSSEMTSTDSRDTLQHARERQRILAALEALLPLPAAQTALDRWQPERRWRAVTAALAEYMVDAVRQRRGVLVSTSDSDPSWIDELARFEDIAGSRILAQNALSVGWTGTIPRKYVMACRTSTEYEDAQAAFERRRTRLNEAASSGYRDLAAKTTVLDSLETPEGRACAQTVLNLIDQSMGGYALTLSRYPLPLAFTVKGTRVLAELPVAMVKEAQHVAEDGSPALDALEFWDAQVPRPSSQNTTTGGFWCYRFDDEAVANILRSHFDHLDEIATKQGEGSAAEILRRHLVETRSRESGAGM